MNKIEYQSVMFNGGVNAETLDKLGSQGWILCYLSEFDSETNSLVGTFYRSLLDDTLNAQIRNKLTPFQTLIDIYKMEKMGQSIPSTLKDEAVMAAEESLKFLTHIGE
jgi:hypothetical protein